MKRPATIDGTALIASTIMRTGRARQPPISLRNTAVVTPSGTEISMARPTCSSVPTSAPGAPPALALSRDPARLPSGVEKGGRASISVIGRSDLRRRTRARAAHDRRRDRVDDQRHREEREPGGHERAEPGAGCRFPELQRDERRDRVTTCGKDVDQMCGIEI